MLLLILDPPLFSPCFIVSCSCSFWVPNCNTWCESSCPGWGIQEYHNNNNNNNNSSTAAAVTTTPEALRKWLPYLARTPWLQVDCNWPHNGSASTSGHESNVGRCHLLQTCLSNTRSCRDHSWWFPKGPCCVFSSDPAVSSPIFVRERGENLSKLVFVSLSSFSLHDQHILYHQTVREHLKC